MLKNKKLGDSMTNPKPISIRSGMRLEKEQLQYGTEEGDYQRGHSVGTPNPKLGTFRAEEMIGKKAEIFSSGRSGRGEWIDHTRGGRGRTMAADWIRTLRSNASLNQSHSSPIDAASNRPCK